MLVATVFPSGKVRVERFHAARWPGQRYLRLADGEISGSRYGTVVGALSSALGGKRW